LSRFQVVPVSLRDAGGRLSEVSDRVAEIRSQVYSTYSAGPATGDSGAAGAYSAMLCTWDTELMNLSGHIGSIGGATMLAGSLYELVDGSLFRFADGGGGGG
jgi:hypothetical protein